MYTSLSMETGFLRNVLKLKFHNASVQSDQRLCCSTVLFPSWLFFIDRKIVCEQCWLWSFIRYIITGRKSFRSATICMDPGVSYRNYLGMCILVWKPMVKTTHGYVILGGSSWLLTWRKQRKRSVSSSTDQISWIGRLEGKKRIFLCQKVLVATKKNAIANGAGPDENIHKEQSHEDQHCLPSYTDSFDSVQL